MGGPGSGRKKGSGGKGKGKFGGYKSKTAQNFHSLKSTESLKKMLPGYKKGEKMIPGTTTYNNKFR